MKEEREVVDRGRIQFQAEFWLFFFFLRTMESPICLSMEGKVPTKENRGSKWIHGRWRACTW